MDRNEFRTRLEMIDVLLKEQGWDVSDRSRVQTEVDTKQSDFVAKSYKTVSETLKNDLESKYADYLLLDSAGAPLAIVEAKRTSKDPELGQQQAAMYADDIKRQTGRDVFIFYTNGYRIIFWDRERYSPREVKGFYARGDLERLRFQKTQDASVPVEVDTSIVDRAKGIECVKRVVEHLQKGHRKGLIVMATGTGKTRVAMAIIKILMEKGLVQKVLFLADRRALRDQAMDKGFKQFFPEEGKDTIFAGKYDTSKRLYVSTIQTFQEIYLDKDKDGQFKLSPGEFDLIISDEAHRSIYNKWKDVFTYFDAIQIGLTATPSDIIDRDTLRFFECHDGSPTALYSYDDAVRDGVLVDFRKSILGAQTHFQIAGVRRQDLTEGERAKLLEQGIDPDEIDFEGTELEKKVAVKGTSEAIVREFMEHALVDQTGTLPAKSIIFAISKKHAYRLQEAFDTLYPEYKGTLARTIVSEDSRASIQLKMFGNESMPRVAISVDMLDTGIDVPEVCNLVFAKPVFSKIKFWQMLGRGTRANSACVHPAWLPEGKKEYFQVFDFWNNFEYWQMNPDGVKNESPDAITNRIFLSRVRQLAFLKERGDEVRAALVKDQILSDIRSLPPDSVSVRDNKEEIRKALDPQLWDNVAVDPVQFLTQKIMPLMRYQKDVNLNTAIFTLRCEQLKHAILRANLGEIERQKLLISGMVECLPLTLDKVKEREAFIREVKTNAFWQSVSYESAERMLAELAPLMPMMSREPQQTIVIDMGDRIEMRELIQMLGEKEQTYITKYRERVEERIKQLAADSPVIQKIARDEVLSEADIRQLEATIFGPDLAKNSAELGKAVTSTESILVSFIKRVLGMYGEPNPADRIRDAFRTYMIENNKHYSADQLNFIRMVESVFSQKKHITYTDFWEPPFITLGNAPEPMFSTDELKTFEGICSRIERELSAGVA
ncbi:MAG: DEAD/DEAH box helicase family protein [Methanoregula sp.]|uniref:type I restriction endonuclease subunit R n=1 Tax=Methanoregula sp. TaxID=2052170 RepID=UPI0025D1E4EE|nr:DEAD/DEAH box helicase family protein [Methanoregula sp.]MCK9631365.1 DEAD/DEAH box helicase family protein [Methanoregula sp.]